MKHKVNNFSEFHATVQEISKDKQIVVYVDVSVVDPSESMKYLNSVRKQIGDILGHNVIWIPTRPELGTKIESLPKGRKVIYYDVAKLSSKEQFKFIQQIKKDLNDKKMLVLPCYYGERQIEIIDESEMNERGWYYYGVKRDGTPVE